jgi:hypothetical protein
MLCASRRLTLATAVTLFIVPVLYSIFVLDMKIIRWEESVATASGPVAPAAPSGRDDGCGSTRIVNKTERCLWGWFHCRPRFCHSCCAGKPLCGCKLARVAARHVPLSAVMTEVHEIFFVRGKT